MRNIYQMRLFKNSLYLITLIGVTLLLSSCRYWSLYQFADQFCDYEHYVEVLPHSNRTRVQFIDPVLPRKVFDRYFKALPHSITKGEYDITAEYRLTRQPITDQPHLKLTTNFSNSGKHYLQHGELGPQLSQVFAPTFVNAILSSACTEDYDLSLDELDVRFEIDPMVRTALPQTKAIESLFGSVKAVTEQGSPTQYRTQLDFVLPASLESIQQRPVKLSWTKSEGQLDSLHVHYDNYQLWLNFESLQARLLVIRNASD